MAENTGIDPMRGRPTPGFASTEEKIQRRKLDSLKRGIHRIRDESGLAYRVHLVGVGGAGAAVVARALEKLSDEVINDDGTHISVLAVDIGNSHGLEAVRKQRARIASKNAQIEILQLDIPSAEDLLQSLSRYPEFLRLEYPLYEGSTYEPWLSGDVSKSLTDEHLPRAIAKAIYGKSYYGDSRPAYAAIKRFASHVASTQGESLVCVCFGLGGGAGSGIAVDLARHISNVQFGRRVLVAGIGIAPCKGDIVAHQRGNLYPVLTELDCMCDESKNRGVVQACGDLYKNPFTAGFLLIPQEHVWSETGSLERTHDRVDRELASLITARKGANLWETLRLLNWVAAPSTQHSAARTPYGARWIHMVGFVDSDAEAKSVDDALRDRLGLLSTYKPEFIEARVGAATEETKQLISSRLQSAFGPSIEPTIADGARSDSLQFILPQVSKSELVSFVEARDAYDAQKLEEKTLNHAWLLERGVLLCEPSTTLDGMAGASLPGQSGWVAVPYASLRGEESLSSVTAESV